MATVKMSLLMSENVTIWDYNHPRHQIDVAVQAEQAGFDSVQFADHVVLGAGCDIVGAPENLRTYMMPGNQPPTFPAPEPDRHDVGRRRGDDPAANSSVPQSLRRCVTRCCSPRSSARSISWPKDVSWWCHRSAGTRPNTTRWECRSIGVETFSTSNSRS